MVETRKSTKMNTTDSSFDILNKKISKTKLAPETKEIFTLLLTFFNSIQVEKDEKIKQFEEEISNMKRMQEEMKKSFEEKLTEIRQQQQDSHDQDERRETLVITGKEMPEFQPGENLKHVLQNKLNESLQLNLNPLDLAYALRLGKKPAIGPDRRGIIFRMSRPGMVGDIMKACRQFKPPFFINTSLTPTRSKIFYALRQCKLKHSAKIHRVRNSGGNIEVCTRSNSKFVAVNSRLCLEKLVRELNIPLDTLGVNW